MIFYSFYVISTKEKSSQVTRQRLDSRCGVTCEDFSFVEMTNSTYYYFVCYIKTSCFCVFMAINYAGICWLKQCNVPNPQMKSIQLIPITSLSGKHSDNIFKATRSLLSLNVGTNTHLFRIKKLA
jgi:hypothetical protein